MRYVLLNEIVKNGNSNITENKYNVEHYLEIIRNNSSFLLKSIALFVRVRP